MQRVDVPHKPAGDQPCLLFVQNQSFMKLNHLNLAVSNVAETQAFFETYFDFKPLTKGSPVLSILQDTDGLVLTLSNFDKASEVHYPDSFHVGFIQDSPERVSAINERLKADGYVVGEPHRAHGSWTFYMTAPGGFLLEVLC